MIPVTAAAHTISGQRGNTIGCAADWVGVRGTLTGAAATALARIGSACRLAAVAVNDSISFAMSRAAGRAVGSSANISGANTVLNTIVAESLDYIATNLESATKSGKDLNTAIQELLPKIVKEHKRVIFNGNNYAEEWHSEAAKRGLANHRNTVEVLPVVTRKDTIELFSKYKVYSEKELTSRFNILSEAYAKHVNIEGQTALMMAKTMILPAALKYQKEVGESIAAAKSAIAPKETC